MMSDLVSRIKSIIEIDEKLEKRLRELEELENTVGFLEKYIVCDPYSEKCIGGIGRITRSIEEWLYLYDRLSETDPDNIIDELPYGFKKYINYKKNMLESICRERELFDCIRVDIKLPIDKEKKQEILDKIKEKIKAIMDEMPEWYLRTVFSVTDILKTIANEIENLKSDYKRLREAVEDLIEATIRMRRSRHE